MIKRGKKKALMIGLTGGPGVGKSEVARVFKAKGVGVIDADKIGHEILTGSPAVRKKLVKILGGDIVAADNSLDRRKIGSMVFGNPSLMYQFNLVVHPPLLRKLKQTINRESARGRRYIVVDAALIYEWGIADWFDLILVVQAKRAVRLARLSKQGLKRHQAVRRISSQMTQKDKAALADYVIDNNSTKRALEKRALEFYDTIRKNF